MDKLCCTLSPLIRCKGCKIDMCYTCGIEHVDHLSEVGWYIISGSYEEAIRFAQDASNTNARHTLRTLYIE